MSIGMRASFAGVLVWLWLAGTAELVQGQALKTNAYVTMKSGRVYIVANHQNALLERAMALTPELKVMTNGVIKIRGDGQEKLTESRRVTLDGCWIGDDGTLLAFKPHYLMKERVLYFVKSGLLRRVDQDIRFGSGVVLRTDGTLLTPDWRLIRLQDGQRLDMRGETIPALDQVMVVQGRLVLQKDGSIIPLPTDSTIGMSDGTKVTGSGLITTPSGEQITLQDDQRLTLPGAAMSRIH